MFGAAAGSLFAVVAGATPAHACDPMMGVVEVMMAVAPAPLKPSNMRTCVSEMDARGELSTGVCGRTRARARTPTHTHTLTHTHTPTHKHTHT
jgi:hypothetical protein